MIHNGIDPDFYRPDEATDALERHGIDPTVPYVLFVGRITRQKGIVHLVRAIQHLDPGIGVVLCAGQPDTPEIGREMEEGVRAAQAERDERRLDRRDGQSQPTSASCTATLPCSAARRSTSRSASSTSRRRRARPRLSRPPWAAFRRSWWTARRGCLVPVALSIDDPMLPEDPDRFERNLAGAINALMADAGTREVMGRAGRRRAVEHFSWDAIARQTADLYRTLIE